MLGGYQVLDLRDIDLSRGTSELSITNAFVLKQLLNIRNHIQKTYDFGKPLENQLKPLLIRYRDKKVGEKHEVACYGNIEVINTYYKFRIIANNEGEQLTINIEFEEKTDEYDNKYWDIKTAKVLLTSAKPIFEEITDKDGHKRFIEGNISIGEKEGVEQLYGKWSLSGSHLMIVVCFTIANGTTLSGGFTDINLPEWILDKIVPIASNVIEYKSVSTFDSSINQQNMTTALRKSTTKLILECGITATADRIARYTCDLLIDNE